MDSSQLKSGQIIPLRYASRDLKAIAIDPNGLGPGKPSIGMGFRGMDRHTRVPQTILSQRVIRSEGDKQLKLLSGNTFRVIHRLENVQ